MASLCARMVTHHQATRRVSMGDVTLIGVDLAKRVFICAALLGMD